MTHRLYCWNCFYRIFRIIGCPHGCGDGCASAGEKGVTLRTQALDLLTRLMRLNKPALLRYLKRALLQQAAQEVMDFLHALLGFCVDPSSGTATAAGTAASRVHSPLDKQAQGTSSLSHKNTSRCT